MRTQRRAQPLNFRPVPSRSYVQSKATAGYDVDRGGLLGNCNRVIR